MHVERIPIRVRTREFLGIQGSTGLKHYKIPVGIHREVVVETYVGPFSRPDRYDWTGLDGLGPAEREAVRTWLERAIQAERREAERRRARREEDAARARACLERMVPVEDLVRLDEAALIEHEARNRVRMRGGRAVLPDHPHTRRWGLPLFRGFFGLDHPSGVSSFASMNGRAREGVYREFRRRVEDWEAGRLWAGPSHGSNDQAMGVLGLPPHASLDQVKRRFRELAKSFHPDKPTGNAEKMKVLAAAYTRIIASRRGA